MSKRYCFTWNNYDEETIKTLEEFAKTRCLYLIYGKEVGESGTPHLQGFCTFKSNQRIVALKKSLGAAPHFEAAKGTSLQAANYCKKDGDFIEFGEAPTPGKRSDLSLLADAVRNGSSLSVVAEIDPATYIRNYRGLANYQALQQKDYTHDKVRGIWYYGPPGTGKSHDARGLSDSLYIKSQNKWFDGYAGETHILLDDLDNNCLGHHLKIWADKYACSGEIKGGTVKLCHTTLIVTSNYSIDELWKDDDVMAAAIKRRFIVKHYVELKPPPAKKQKKTGHNYPEDYASWSDQKKTEYYHHTGHHPNLDKK